MTKTILILFASAALVLTACSPKPFNSPTLIQPGSEQTGQDLPGKVQAAGLASLPDLARPAAQNQSACPIPAGWAAYQVQINETVYSIAARAGINAGELLKANCANSAAALHTGTWLVVPPATFATAPQTLLPLGISAFVADPLVVPAGGIVHLAWQAMGPVIGVRVGWMYGDRFVEEVANLPAGGSWHVQVPADGRGSITYMIRASDGVQEVAAQTTISVRCPEGWFFGPAPSGCPLPPLATIFHEQAFERGTIVYIPALRLHYALVSGQPAWQIADTFVPGMPLDEPALDSVIPAGLLQPSGPIFYAWRSGETLSADLGYAVGEERIYAGMHQRSVSAAGETVTFSAGSGWVYTIAPGGVWQATLPQ